MNFESLTLIMTFVGGPFLLAIIGLFVWFVKRVFNSDEIPKETIVKTENGNNILKRVGKLETDMVHMQATQESILRELQDQKSDIEKNEKKRAENVERLYDKLDDIKDMIRKNK
jgi:uncharacterized coiled-coil protein SlyX